MTWSVANWLVATVVLAAHAWLGLLAARLKRWPGVTTLGLGVLGIGSFLTIGFEHALPQSIAMHMIQVAYTWVNVVAFFIGFFVFFHIDATRLRKVCETFPDRWQSPVTWATVATTALVLCAIGSATRAPEVKRVRVEVRNLDRTFTIVQLSDLHLGVWGRGEDEFARVVDRVVDLRPDIVVITGDTIDGTVDQLWRDVSPLARLARQLPTYMVLGNHETLWGEEAWSREFRRLGAHVLRNDAVWLHEPCVWLVGVDDVDSEEYDPNVAFAEVDPSAPKIVLAHQPRAVFDVTSRDVNLILAGDTHGGQVWPFGWAIAWLKQNGRVSGLYREKGTTSLYVSEGTGWGGAPLRVGTTPEITLITLVPSDAEEAQPINADQLLSNQ